MLAVFLMALASGAACADDFWDQGFKDGAWRTDFISDLAGTQLSPLTYDSQCLFPELLCGNGPQVGEPTSAGTSLGMPGDRYWVVSINNEPAFENFTGGSVAGVPGQAHPLPQNGPMWTYYPESFTVSVDTEAGENFPRAHLIVRHQGPTNSHDEKGADGIPFVSIGAQANRGNGVAVGALNNPFRPHNVQFTANLFDWKTSDSSNMWAFIYAISAWPDEEGNTIQRGVFLTLKHMGDRSDLSAPDNPGHPFDWNWPIRESFFYPGVDWGFIDSEDLNSGPASWHCGFTVPPMMEKLTDYQIKVDLQKLFECASRRGLFRTPLPDSSELPIKGIHWAVEMSGADAYLWMAVHDMKMSGFKINAGLNDAWFNPETNGQGFFITVFPDLGIASLAWFTYDTELPPDPSQANLGDPGHRWLTATGPIQDNRVLMDIEMTSGGLFDMPTDIQRTDPVGSDGTIKLTFTSCNSGTVEYDIPSINRQGTVPIQRVAADNIELCETLATQ